MPSGTDPVLFGETSAREHSLRDAVVHVTDNNTGATMRSSIASILHNQRDNGAIVASPDFAEYRYCWLRDGSFIAYALDQVGEHRASTRYHEWVNRAIGGISDLIDRAIEWHQQGRALHPDHMPPARFTLDGLNVVDDWPNFQIDGYGTWLWAFGQHLLTTDQDAVPEEFRGSVERVGRYLDAFALTPCFDVWEESGSALHTSTLACVYGGLTAAARLLDDEDLLERAKSVQSRARESAVRLGRYVKSSESDDVDASVLWLSTPFCVAEPDDHYFTQTVRTIEARLSLDGGLRRYPTDTYFGGGAWPVLTASLGWHHLAVGDLDAARRCRDWVTTHFDDKGRLGEQFGGERRDPEHYREWVARWGPPAKDLTWSHAMYVVLCAALGDLHESDARGALVHPTEGQTEAVN
jgi:GH15 family glucan-1,4-alpha-glucosidase